MEAKLNKSYNSFNDVCIYVCYSIKIDRYFINKHYRYYDKITVDYINGKLTLIELVPETLPDYLHTNIDKTDKHFYETYLNILDMFIENDIKENILTRLKNENNGNKRNN